MKKSFVILSLCLCLLTACHGQEPPSEAAPSSGFESVVSAPSPEAVSSSGGASSDAVLEASPLSVAVQIVAEYENPEVYSLGGNARFTLGTQESLQAYEQWIEALDGAEVEEFYGCCAPWDPYTPGAMSQEDSQALFDKLKAVRPSLLSEEDFKNPPTGGVLMLSLRSKTGAAVISFNGSWFVVQMEGSRELWVFAGEESPAQELCYEMWQMVEDNMNLNADTPPDLFYRGKKVENIYAADTKAYVMAQVSSYSHAENILSALEGYQADESRLEKFAYLLFTEEGKEYIYLDDSSAGLPKRCMATLINSPLHPSWLIHMSPERMVSANGVTDREKLSKLSAFLKEAVTVQAETTSYQGPDNPVAVAGLYSLEIVFDSGTSYRLTGYDHGDASGEFTLYTSDLDRTVSYQCDEGVSAELREFLEQLGM